MICYGSIGTPIIAVESGYIEALGWNQYGGWRVGIRSFDGKRYYYYAHLRKNHPYAENLKESDSVKAGDVIEIKEKCKGSQRYKDIIEVTGGRTVPAWVEVDQENLKGEIKELPKYSC